MYKPFKPFLVTVTGAKYTETIQGVCYTLCHKEIIESVYTSSDQIIASRNIWLAERQKAVDAFNQKFGTKVKVSFRAYNDMLDMMEVNGMSLEEMASVEEGEENV